MKKSDIEKIVDFLDYEIKDYDLDYDYETQDEIMIVTFKGHFTSNHEIEMSFRVINKEIEFYGLCESYILATTREFWINLMGNLK